MSGELLQQLATKIDETIETIEIMKMRIEELEELNLQLQKNNNLLREKQSTWEESLKSMLSKVNNVEYFIDNQSLADCEIK